MAREAGFRVGPSRDGPDEVRGAGLNLRWFEALIREDERDKAIEETNRRANASWALMCEKMVAAEREACAKVCDEWGPKNMTATAIAEEIRARGDK
jgi:hypothetical protein